MKVKKIPLRTCVITKEKLPKAELVRVVRTPEGEVIIDTTGKANGRGAYLKKDLETFENYDLQICVKKILDYIKTKGVTIKKEIEDEER